MLNRIADTWLLDLREPREESRHRPVGTIEAEGSLPNGVSYTSPGSRDFLNVENPPILGSRLITQKM
ncbi:hypothetical protein AUH73_08445 [archaeon 13_1_40CM_4_53_4]|nr:MAG: hypothetical protein AUI07_03850 [archaeon 13_2_20CM_2_53_6]OLC60946.1 MAG: hypothetical protein AUH73_08445 [archaeon 13_1_40CM_4_53_4]OLE58298.1 MAG: hypothetical protein AUG17_08100 [Crenarchaeota archaeon 13_1_20CM_2_53_14]